MRPKCLTVPLFVSSHLHVFILNSKYWRSLMHERWNALKITRTNRVARTQLARMKNIASSFCFSHSCVLKSSFHWGARRLFVFKEAARQSVSLDMTDYPFTKTWKRFSKAASLVWGPLAPRRAALVLLCFPNSNAAFLSLRRGERAVALRLRSPPFLSEEQDAVSAAVKRLEWKLLRLGASLIIQCFSARGPRSTSVTFGSINWGKRWEIAVVVVVLLLIRRKF